jgi:hypothetical protein
MSDPTKGKADVAALHRRIDEMADAIGPIVAAHTESEKIHADKRQAHIELVTKMLELAQPTVRALGSRPAIAQAFFYDGAHGEEQLADWRGLILTTAPSAVPPGYPGGSLPQGIVALSSAANVGRRSDGTADFLVGTYTGSDVFLREDGQLVQLSYEGTWKKEPQHHGEWRATETEISVGLFCRDDGHRRCAADPKNLATRLAGHMSASGTRKKSMAKATAAMSKFRAIATLL